MWTTIVKENERLKKSLKAFQNIVAQQPFNSTAEMELIKFVKQFCSGSWFNFVDIFLDCLQTLKKKKLIWQSLVNKYDKGNFLQEIRLEVVQKIEELFPKSHTVELQARGRLSGPCIDFLAHCFQYEPGTKPTTLRVLFPGNPSVHFPRLFHRSKATKELKLLLNTNKAIPTNSGTIM